MRIVNVESDKPLNNISIYLTSSEAKQMFYFLEALLKGKTDHHVHINDENYEHEVTIAIYKRREA